MHLHMHTHRYTLFVSECQLVTLFLNKLIEVVLKK